MTELQLKTWCEHLNRSLKVAVNVVDSMKAWNGHPNSKFEICYLEFQIRIWNSKYIFGIQIPIWNSNTVFRIPNMLFGILNTYLEFEICYSVFQIRIWNSKYPIRNSKYSIQNSKYAIRNSKYAFGILNVRPVRKYNAPPSTVLDRSC